MAEPAEVPYVAFGSRLDAIIRRQGRSNKWIAERTRVGQVQVSRWRNGKALPDGLQLFLLSEALNEDVSAYLPADHVREKELLWYRPLLALGARLKGFAAAGQGLVPQEVAELAELYLSATAPGADHEASTIEAADLSGPPGSKEAPPDVASG